MKQFGWQVVGCSMPAMQRHFHTPVYLTPPLMGFPFEFCIGAGVSENQNDGAFRWSKSKKFSDRFSGFDTIPECDGHPASLPPSHVAVAITLNALATASSLIIGDGPFQTKNGFASFNLARYVVVRHEHSYVHSRYYTRHSCVHISSTAVCSGLVSQFEEGHRLSRTNSEESYN